MRLASVLHPSLDELLYKLMSEIHSAMKQERQEVANQQTFAEGDPKHLVLTQTKTLPDPFDIGLVPQQDRASLPRVLRLLGFLCHRSIMAPS